MASVLDLLCTTCGLVEPDHLFVHSDDVNQIPACPCGGKREIKWAVRWNRSAAWSSSDRIALWKHPGTGDVKYPGRNDVAMPSRYRNQGYVREELATLADATRHEKSTGTVCEALHWDRNGKADRETTVSEPKTTYSDLLN